MDRRLLPALRFISRLPQTDAWAVHVSFDADQTIQLATDWMNLGLTWLPLHIHDHTAERLGASVAQVVQQEAGAARCVTVVIPELDLYVWWHRLLHRRSARHIAREVQRIPRVTAVIVPFSTVLPKATRR